MIQEWMVWYPWMNGNGIFLSTYWSVGGDLVLTSNLELGLLH